MTKATTKETCSTCKGNGFDCYLGYIDYMTPCPNCEGEGFVEKEEVTEDE